MQAQLLPWFLLFHLHEVGVGAQPHLLLPLRLLLLHLCSAWPLHDFFFQNFLSQGLAKKGVTPNESALAHHHLRGLEQGPFSNTS